MSQTSTGSKRKPSSNVYTVLMLAAALVLGAGVAFVIIRAQALYGDLFSLTP